MVYVTGDIHGDQISWDIGITSYLKKDDMIVVTGDFGIGFFDGKYWSEDKFLDCLAEQSYTTVFCDGNHENFDKLKRYEIIDWHGGKARCIRKNVIHLMRGEIYEIEGKSVFVMGGGYSVDKLYRDPGVNWWPDEMPSEIEYQKAKDNLKCYNYRVNCILTHTAPCGTIEYMLHKYKGIKNTGTGEMPLTGFLGWVEEMADYDKWYFGHFHLDAELWKNQYAMYTGIREFFTGEIVKSRY